MAGLTKEKQAAVDAAHKLNDYLKKPELDPMELAHLLFELNDAREKVDPDYDHLMSDELEAARGRAVLKRWTEMGPPSTVDA